MAATMDPAMAAYLAAAQQIAATQDFTQDQRASTRNLSIAFTVLAVVFVVFRFMARFKQGVKIMWDDWLMILALILLGGNLACNIVMINNGLGLHSGALTLEGSMNIGKILLVNEPLYVTNINVIKISLLLLYYRIFPIRSVKLGCWILGGISTMWNLVLIGLAEGQCIPIKKSWAPWTAGHCINLGATFLAISVPSILTDVAILALPLPHVWRLQTNLAQRISLMFIFLLGSFVVFTSIYRFTVYIKYDPNDLPYTLALGCAWNIVELSSGIISACLPTVGPLVRIVFTQLGSSLNRSRATSNVDKRSRSNGSGLVTIGGGGHSRKQRSQDWNKLDDGSHVVVTTTAPSERGSGDEIPLRAIRQQRDVEWTVERKV